jgi:hypothetical protein
MGSFVERTYGMYDEFRGWWNFCLDSYEGGDDYLRANYLYRHVKEDESDFRDRIQRSYYYNFCRTVVDTYVAHIFRKATAIYRRGDDSGEYERFLSDVDARGNSMNVFMQEQVAPAAQIFGQVFVVVDKPKFKGELKSKAEEREKGIRPYLVAVDPRDVVDFQFDSRGNVLWVRMREVRERPSDPFYKSNASDDEEYVYRTWTREGWFLHDAEGNLIEADEHALGRVPVVIVYNVESRKYPAFGVSALSDIAPINRSIYNWCSLNDEFLYRQCFNILAMPEMPGVKRRKIGPGNALTYPIDAARPPHYIYPPVEPGEYLLKNIDAAIRQIYRLAVLGAAWGIETPQSASGISKAYDLYQTNENLVKKAKNLEQAEAEIGAIWGLWEGKEGFKPTVEYPTDFKISDLAEDLKNDFAVLKMNISESFNKALKKRAAARYIKLDPKEMERVTAEIEGDESISPARKRKGVE